MRTRRIVFDWRVVGLPLGSRHAVKWFLVERNVVGVLSARKSAALSLVLSTLVFWKSHLVSNVEPGLHWLLLELLGLHIIIINLILLPRLKSKVGLSQVDMRPRAIDGRQWHTEKLPSLLDLIFNSVLLGRC